MAPALSNIWAACLLTNGMQFFAAHEVLEIVVVFPFGRAHSQPFRTALRNDGRHDNFLVLVLGAMNCIPTRLERNSLLPYILALFHDKRRYSRASSG